MDGKPGSKWSWVGSGRYWSSSVQTMSFPRLQLPTVEVQESERRSLVSNVQINHDLYHLRLHFFYCMRVRVRESVARRRGAALSHCMRLQGSLSLLLKMFLVRIFLGWLRIVVHCIYLHSVDFLSVCSCSCLFEFSFWSFISEIDGSMHDWYLDCLNSWSAFRKEGCARLMKFLS